MTATLTQAGIPLAHTAVVSLTVTKPSGAVYSVRLDEVGDGAFRRGVPTPAPGVYRLLVHAEGATLRGLRFTREELRTLSVWSRGDDPAPGRGSQPAGPDWCGLLSCLLDDAVLGKAGRKAGHRRLCQARHCTGRSELSKAAAGH